MGTLLESAISAKQDAISLQLKYYEKILEFQTECDSLRKFVIILSIVPLFLCVIRILLDRKPWTGWFGARCTSQQNTL